MYNINNKFGISILPTIFSSRQLLHRSAWKMRQIKYCVLFHICREDQEPYLKFTKNVYINRHTKILELY